MGPKTKTIYNKLENRLQVLLRQRAAVKPLHEEDHAAYDYMGELDAEIEEIEAQQQGMRDDDHDLRMGLIDED